MSVILKLRMLSDEDDCFLRDYEVPYESTLEELHDFICNDLQYEKIPESSFFEADREWNRRREYTHADAGATGSDSSASRCRMSENRLSDILPPDARPADLPLRPSGRPGPTIWR